MSCNCHEEIPESVETWWNESCGWFEVVHIDAHGQEINRYNCSAEELAPKVKELTFVQI